MPGLFSSPNPINKRNSAASRHPVFITGQRSSFTVYERRILSATYHVLTHHQESKQCLKRKTLITHCLDKHVQQYMNTLKLRKCG